ncbi:hypothetical protein IQB76_20035, partial [Leptospira borgpetersenii serovar Hardjo-bovis]|nr:hypothetical protein [Leptospira borgpetersenii serovar Hardjo-bovis]
MNGYKLNSNSDRNSEYERNTTPKKDPRDNDSHTWSISNETPITISKDNAV